MKANLKNKGFTLIELLVVIAIIALLSATIFAALSTARQKSRDANRIATARSLKTALALYEDKYGSVIGINGLSASGAGAQILVASGTNSIADVLKNEGFLDRKVAGDSVYGTSEYYLGVAADGRYDVYAKLERPESSMSSSTLALGTDGADALAAGYNYASGFGGGVGTGGGGTVAQGGGGGPVTGGAAYVTPGTYSWTAPAGVTSVSVVAVGGGGAGISGGTGGGLGWKNTITVVPGNSYTVVVGAGGAKGPGGPNNGGDSYFISAGTVAGGGGKGGTASPVVPGGVHVGTGGGDGGVNGGGYGAGTGAGGYAGNGGTGNGGSNGGNGSGGAGGGAGYSLTVHNNVGSAAGGGVGIWGQGANGVGSTGCFSTPCGNALPGGSGSGGTNGSQMTSASTNEMTPGLFGAGGGYNDSGFGAGGGGAVRIIWPGDTRLFPATSTASTTGETTI